MISRLCGEFAEKTQGEQKKIFADLLSAPVMHSDRTWNKEMRSLIQEMIHYRNGLDDSEECSPEKIAEYEGRYRAILQKAKEECEYIPASDYYTEGYNLYLRMEEYMANHLLFLHDRRVPATNNEAERLLRGYKRKPSVSLCQATCEQ